MIKKNGMITSTEAEVLLGVKQRRARAILKAMVEDGMIRRTGAAKNTKYVLMEDGSNSADG